MEMEIKKEHFTNENFDTIAFLNNLLKNGADLDSDIINFKLKILQRELGNELDLTSNNLLKFSKILENDVAMTNTSSSIVLQNVNKILETKLNNKKLEILEKANRINHKNKNLEVALEELSKV